jgi:hypothetical protein
MATEESIETNREEQDAPEMLSADCSLRRDIRLRKRARAERFINIQQ